MQPSTSGLFDAVARKVGVAARLDALPGIGPGLAGSIHQITVRGRLPLLGRLRGQRAVL